MNIIVTDPNSKFYFDEEYRNKKTYLGAEDGYNLLIALANNHPENTYYVLQDTENYCELKKTGVFKRLFKNHNVVFYTDEILTHYPDIKGERITNNGHLMNNVKKVVDQNDKLAKKVDGIIALTVPGENNITCFSRNEDGSLYTTDNEWARSFYICYFMRRHPEIPLLAFHVDERFVYPQGEVFKTARIPDLIMGFQDRLIQVKTPKYEYPNGMVSKEKVTRTVKSIYGSNDHISLLNFQVPSHPDWKLGDIHNFYRKEKETYPVKIFYNQLRFGYTDDPNSPFAFVDRLQTFKQFGLFEEFKDNELQFYTNIKFNDPEIVNHYPSYFNQSLPKNKMIDELAKQKYSLIISNSKKTAMSQKVWECLSIGVIPFMLNIEGVSEYGSEHYTKEIWDLVPEFTVVHSAKEMKERIDFLESHPDEKRKLINRLMKNWDDGFVTGKVVSDALIDNLKKVIKNPINSYKSFLDTINIVYVDGPKLSGKTTEIQQDIKEHGYSSNEYIVVHSNMKAKNDYSYFSNLLDLNFDEHKTIFDNAFDNKKVLPLEIKYEDLKAVYFDRGCISEYIYGEIWEMINLGILKSDSFKLGTLDLDLIDHSNVDINDIKKICNKDTIKLVVKFMESDESIKDAIIKNEKIRKQSRLTNYEKDTLEQSNSAFKTMNRLFLTKDINKHYKGIPWKKDFD